MEIKIISNFIIMIKFYFRYIYYYSIILKLIKYKGFIPLKNIHLKIPANLCFFILSKKGIHFMNFIL